MRRSAVPSVAVVAVAAPVGLLAVGRAGPIVVVSRGVVARRSLDRAVDEAVAT